jgi:CheY-like chemotaxis protein
MIAMLEDLGHQVLAAGSGDEALGLLSGTPDVDLVITDQAMPVMTGAQLAERIRASRPGLPVIIASGYGELPLGLSVERQLAKPFAQDALAMVVSAAVEATPVEDLAIS